MYTTAKRSHLGVNWDCREHIHVTINNYAWVKYVALALAVVALRFLCCA